MTVLDVHSSRPIDRRRFLQQSGIAVVSAAALAACGGKQERLVVVNYFADGYVVPGAQRLPIGLGDVNGVVDTGGPATLKGRVFDDADALVVDDVTVKRHDDGVPRPYWPVQLALSAPGIYRLELDLPGGKESSRFTVADPSKVVVPKPGEKLPPFETPTIADGRGVTPICTRSPACPLHDLSLAEALQKGLPTVYIVSTPAHCKQAVCGPVLDLVVEQATRLAGKVTVVHAEVYTDDSIRTTAPAVNAYNLAFEPVIWFADTNGTITDRLDIVFDRAELTTAFDRIVS